MDNKTIIIFSLTVLLFISCNKPGAPDCFKTTGEITTEVRYPGTFRTILLNSDIDLVLIQGNETKVEIKAGKNLQDKIITTLSNETLEIDNKNQCNMVRGYKKKIEIRITLPHLRRVYSKGVGNIRSEGVFVQDSLELNTQSIGDIDFECDSYELVVNTGSHGDVYLKGKATRFYIYSTLANFVYAENISVKDYVYVRTNNLGDCTVNVDKTVLFEYQIINSGNIYFSGTPGKITDLGDDLASGKAIPLP
jgi:hypothetical protein